MRKIYIASDHNGFELKEKIKKFLDKKNISYVDFGTNSKENVDYTDFAKKVAEKIQNSPNDRGILICGSGLGMVIAANKFKGIRAVKLNNITDAKMSRLDNDANIMSLSGKSYTFLRYKKIIMTFLDTNFSNLKRYKRRIDKINDFSKDAK
jgi:ribose 5-phosphate isomerase B